MRSPKLDGAAIRHPQLQKQAAQLATYIDILPTVALVKSMHVSKGLAERTKQLFAAWGSDTSQQSVALDSFVGDIYSGLQAPTFSAEDRNYADQHLRILSGLYGVIRPLDTIYSYRLEMGYRFPDKPYKNLYTFWGDSIAKTLPGSGVIVNASSVEYTKAVLPYVDKSRVITPQFLTTDTGTGEPKFVTVHAKIARGAFAHWLIKTKTQRPADFIGFDELGYCYKAELSTPSEPAFVTQTFGGIGLSLRLR